MNSGASASAFRLSVCIATFFRAAYIGATLENILAQCPPDVEVLVVDGASPDDTCAVVRRVQERHPRLMYYREDTNSGVDHDFDKAVGYARGAYCWLLSDDDLLVPGAMDAVLHALEAEPDLVVVNAEVRDKSMRTVIKRSQLALHQDRTYCAQEMGELLSATGPYLSFIGAVVVRRSVWLARQRAPYYGSLFIHVGVLFQEPALVKVQVLAAPLIRIRYGNAMWTARGFEIWVEKWPRLVWSLGHLDEACRAAVTPRHPARSLKALLWYRAIGAYGAEEYRSLLADGRVPHHPLARLVAALPARFANAAVALYLRGRGDPDAALKLYDLERARCASALARRFYRALEATTTA